MRVLVTGGAGYIGSVVAEVLLARGHAVSVYDDLSEGHRDAVPDGARLLASARAGERHDPETHLIPIVLQAAAGRRPTVTIHGDDYPTRDGTCVRDYVHVLDLAEAHALAVDALAGGAPSTAYNLGCGGDGFTVREVIDTAARVTGRAVPAQVGPRRPGDPATLVAASTCIRHELGWRPRHSDLDEIIRSAWTWMTAAAAP